MTLPAAALTARRPARMAGTVRSPSALARVFRAARGLSPGEGALVREADAAALVADAAVALALRGHAPVVTHENGPRLVRLGALMLDAFCIGGGREAAEENDG